MHASAPTLLLLVAASPAAALVATAAIAAKPTRTPPPRPAAMRVPSDSRSRKLIKQAYNARNLSYEERQALEAYERRQQGQIVPRIAAACLLAAAALYFAGDAQMPEVSFSGIIGSLPPLPRGGA